MLTDTSFLPPSVPGHFLRFHGHFFCFNGHFVSSPSVPGHFLRFYGHFFCFNGHFTSSPSVPGYFLHFHGHFFCFNGHFASSLSAPGHFLRFRGHFFCFNGHFALHDHFLSFRGAALLSVYPIPRSYFNPNRHDFPLKPSFTLDFPTQTCYPIIQIYSRNFLCLIL